MVKLHPLGLSTLLLLGSFAARTRSDPGVVADDKFLLDDGIHHREKRFLKSKKDDFSRMKNEKKEEKVNNKSSKAEKSGEKGSKKKNKKTAKKTKEISTDGPTRPTSTSPSLSRSESPAFSPPGSPSASISSSKPPTDAPSDFPSGSPTQSPSKAPTRSSGSPTLSLPGSPSASISPSKPPTDDPSDLPSGSPTQSPSKAPTRAPSDFPSGSPTPSPSQFSSNGPSLSPSTNPSDSPSRSPSVSPSDSPTDGPSDSPSDSPTHGPSDVPTYHPSEYPSIQPSSLPSSTPSMFPSSSPTRPLAFQQIGERIEDFSSDVSLSSDAQRLAVGAPLSSKGSVSILQKDGIDSAYVPLGQAITGDNFGDQFGRELALSGDGKYFAAGATEYVRVHNWNGSTWNLVGNAIELVVRPSSVDLSYDGQVVVIGEDTYGQVTNSIGRVRVLDLVNNSWVPRHELIGKNFSGGFFGRSMSMSADGRYVAAGAPNYNPSGLGSNLGPGQVTVHVWNDKTPGWTTIGTLNGKNERGANGRSCDEFGTSVSLVTPPATQDVYLAVGAVDREECWPSDPFTGPFYSYAQVYKFNSISNDWDEYGQEIDNLDYLFGSYISLSSDGQTVAVSSRSTNNVRVYEYSIDSDTWVPIGDLTGSLVDVSNDGTSTVVAVGTQIISMVSGVVTREIFTEVYEYAPI